MDTANFQGVFCKHVKTTQGHQTALYVVAAIALFAITVFATYHARKRLQRCSKAAQAPKLRVVSARDFHGRRFFLRHYSTASTDVTSTARPSLDSSADIPAGHPATAAEENSDHTYEEIDDASIQPFARSISIATSSAARKRSTEATTPPSKPPTMYCLKEESTKISSCTTRNHTPDVLCSNEFVVKIMTTGVSDCEQGMVMVGNMGPDVIPAGFGQTLPSQEPMYIEPVDAVSEAENVDYQQYGAAAW